MQNQIFDRPLSLRMYLLRGLVSAVVQPMLDGRLHPVEARRRFERAMIPIAKLPEGITLRPGQLRGVPVEWLLPRGAPVGFILYFHGGAFVLGSPRSFRRLTGRLALRAGAAVCSVDYRLAPEHPFPGALQDALQVYREVLHQGFAAKKIVLAGDSAGGGLAVTTALAACEEGLPAPAAVVTFSPWVDLTLSGQSIIDQRGEERVLRVGMLHRAAGLYVGQRTQPSAPEVSPLFGDLQALPPLLVQVAGREILYDDAVRLAEEAHLVGCPTTLQQWPQLFHGWQGLAGLGPEADEALELAAGFIREHLGAAPEAAPA